MNIRSEFEMFYITHCRKGPHGASPTSIRKPSEAWTHCAEGLHTRLRSGDTAVVPMSGNKTRPDKRSKLT